MGIIKTLIGRNRIFKPYHQPHDEHLPLLRVRDLSLKYEGRTALSSLTFEVHAGKRIAVIGPNGAGKSSLFKIIAGVTRPSSGSIDVYGSEPSGHICIAYLPQRSHVDWHFPANVFDVVMMGRVSKIGILRRSSKRDEEIVSEALEVVGLSEMAKRQINQLSGGQQQRAFIARALAQEAELMLMDEPMTGLDAKSQEGIFQILDQLEQRRVTVMVSLHDMQMAAEHFEQVMLLNKTLLGFGTAETVFNSKALLEAYGGHVHFLKNKEGSIAISDTCCDGGEDVD